ncbi:hypothetical protein A0M51_02680, partial [Campylobacter jejuni]
MSSVENIQECLENWNFYMLEKIYELNIENDIFTKEYVLYLTYTGQFYKILQDCKLRKIFEEIFPNSYRSEVDKLLKTKDELVDIKEYSSVSRESIGCYLLLNIINNFRYIPEEVLDIFKNYLIVDDVKISSYKIPKPSYEILLSKKFFISRSIDYFEMFKDNVFFMKATVILAIIQWLFPKENGSKRYYLRFSSRMKNGISKSEISTSKNVKVAVCISGAMRGDYLKPIDQIVDNIVKPLNADVFVFSWSEHLKWPGICGGSNWVYRLLSQDFNLIAPNEIRNNHLFKQLFQHTYNKLDREISDVLEIQDLKKIYNCKKVVLENQKAFIEQTGLKEHSYTATKLYYGCFRVFELMEEYEKENNIKYDYVIRIRPDCNFAEVINIEDLLRLEDDEIYIAHHLHMNGRVSDSFSCGKRGAMEKLLLMWKRAEFNKQMQEFVSYPKKFDIETHMLLFRWLIANNLVANTAFPYPLLGGSSTVIKDFPDITEELKKDISILRENNTYKEEKLQSFINFFSRIQEKYNIIKPKLFYHFIYSNSAKARIQNQLSYKLGQAMIVNSKSIFGYIRMPFVLSYIYDKHKQEQKIFQEKIKKDPSLKLPPLEAYPDYKEALKEKECFTYKLGQELIKANKNWYGGGYIKLLLEIRKLK